MPTTGNLFEVVSHAEPIPYKELRRGQFFTIGRDSDYTKGAEIIFKCGTKAISFINGSERSMDQATLVVPLPIGTIIKITIGAQT